MTSTNIQPVYLLSYDHGGYILWGPHFEERLESAVSWLDKYPKFRIGLDNEAFAYDKYAEINPEVIERIRHLLKKYEGRFAIGSCSYGQPLSVFINEESNVRQLVYAVRTNLKYYGTTPEIYAISEHALHSQIPQLIAQTGFKGALMRTHFMMYGYNPTYNQPYGWWIGEDGTKVPAVPTYDGQGAQFAITTYDNWVLTRWPDQTDRSLKDFADKFSHIKPLLGSRYDDIVLRCEKLVEYAENTDKYKWVTLEDLPGIYGTPEAEFHPSANEFVVRMPWGYCGNKIFNGCRQAELSAVTAERVNAAAVLAGGTSMQQDLEHAWKNLLISQHHDIQICGLLDDAAQYIPASLDSSRKVIDESMQYLASLFKTNYEHNLIIFNPLSWNVKQVVTTEISLPRGKGVRSFNVICNGKAVSCEFLPLDRKQDKITRTIIRFVADVDALTACCYTVVPVTAPTQESGTVVSTDRLPSTDNDLSSGKTGQAYKDISAASTGVGPSEQSISYDSQSGVLHTSKYIIKLSEYGICSISDMATGELYADNGSGALFRGIIDNKDCRSTGKWTVHCYREYAIAEYYGEIGGIGIEFEMTVSNITGRIDCKAAFIHHGEKIGTAEKFESFADNTNGFIHEDKLRFFMSPCTDKHATGVRDLPFLISETDDKYVQGNYWTAASDGRTGLAYFNKGAMCAVREEDVFSLPLAYSNEYVWGDRYLYGRYTHEFALYPFRGGWEQADLHKRSLEYEYPLVTARAGLNPEGRFVNSVSFLDIKTSDNIILSALYSENGSIIARFYEYKGKDGQMHISGDFADIRDEVNVLGEHIADIKGSEVEFSSHQIKSIRLSVTNETSC